MIAPILLLAALFVSMLFDLRTREVPAVLTLASLFGAAAYGLWQGLWSPVLLIVSLSHIADFNPREKRLAFSAITVAFCCIFQPQHAGLSQKPEPGELWFAFSSGEWTSCPSGYSNH